MKKNVYYVVEVKNNKEREPKIAFYAKKGAEEFIDKNNLPYYNGCDGFKIEEGEEKKSIKIHFTYKEYLQNNKKERTKKLKETIQEVENEMQ